MTGVLLAEGGAVQLADAVAGTGVPLLSLWAALLIAAYLPVVAARMLGTLLYLRGDDLGQGAASEYLEPVLAGAVPRGSPRVSAG